MSALPGMQHVGDETLLDLVHGFLEGGTRRSVLEHVRSCPACAARFRETVQARERARIAAAPVAPASGTRMVLTWTAAAAAVLAVVSFLALWRRGPEIPADWLPTATTEVFLRDVTACSDQGEALRAVEAYRAHDAAAVVALLDGRELPAACDPVKLLLASALVHQGRAASALEVLDDLTVQTLPQPARDRALWTQAAALDQVRRRRDADGVLRDLAARPGHYRDRATELLAAR